MQGVTDIYSKKLEKTVSMSEPVVENLENGYSLIYSSSDMKYINKDGEIVENTEIYADEKMHPFCQNGKWGFANKNDEIMVNCEYDIVTEVNEYGFAGVKKDGKWGVVNEDGQIIVKPEYELDVYYFPQFVGEYLLIQSEIVYCVKL